jgi:hypothetical protein
VLKFDPAWRFASPGALPGEALADFIVLIRRVAGQHPNRQHILEHYKRFFADAAGRPSYTSSSLSWAESDLRDYMGEAGAKAPMFIEAFYDAGNSMNRANPEIIVPDVESINYILAKHGIGYEIQLPNLVSRNPQQSIPVPERPASLDEQAHDIIQRSLKEAEEALALGRGRQAVQEVLWLLETVATAFQGIEIGEATVQGKYFNKIAHDLRRHHRGKTVEQVIAWMTTLHGYLSSPTGGGVRHGATLKSEEMLIHEARLFCNLIRSYLSFLLEEHERLSRGD